MVEYKIKSDTLTAIADAIREKEGSTDFIPVTDMAARISTIKTGGEITSYLWRNVVGNNTQVMNLSADSDILTELYNNGSFYVTVSDQNAKVAYKANVFRQGRYNSTLEDGFRGIGYYSTDIINVDYSSSAISQVVFDPALGHVSIQLTAPYFFDDAEYAITISKL